MSQARIAECPTSQVSINCKKRRELLRSHPYSFPNGIVDFTKKHGRRSFNRTPYFGREKRSYGPLPELPQLRKRSAKGLISVVYVEQIFCPIGMFPTVMDQEFLHENTPDFGFEQEAAQLSDTLLPE